MAPEQLLGKAIDHRADIYSWGTTAYELLTKLRPFGGRTPEESRRNQLDEKYLIKPAHIHNPQVPVGLSQFIQRCLTYHPTDRFPNMTIMNAQLHTLLGVQYQPATPSTPVLSL